MFRSSSLVNVVASLAPVRHTLLLGARVSIFLPRNEGLLYSMVIFLPWSVTSAVPGGLGRLLLSTGCCGVATAVNTSVTRKIASRFLMGMWVPLISFIRDMSFWVGFADASPAVSRVQ